MPHSDQIIIYIYIYIERERENVSERDRETFLLVYILHCWAAFEHFLFIKHLVNDCLFSSVYIYIYI